MVLPASASRAAHTRGAPWFTICAMIASQHRTYAAFPLLLLLSGCQALDVSRPADAAVAAAPIMPAPVATPPAPAANAPAVDLRTLTDFAAILPQLAARRVVFVGETHTRPEDHGVELEVIQGLYARDPNLAIGVEFFQQPFQQYLDAYVAGKLDERGLLRKTEYYKRWGYDFRLYAPILRFAREHHLPLIALNVPEEITSKVGRKGLESLTAAERASLPTTLDDSDPHYRARLKEIFGAHPHGPGLPFERFLSVQVIWDEGMAERAALCLLEHPQRRLVVLAGSGHIAYGTGIPRRMARRIEVPYAIVLTGPEQLHAGAADFVLLPQARQLAPRGALGLQLEQKDGGLRVAALLENSAAGAAGVLPGDRIVQLDGIPVKEMEDLRVALWDKTPGALVDVRLVRDRWLRSALEKKLLVRLR